jgi:hypothetical protein
MTTLRRLEDGGLAYACLVSAEPHRAQATRSLPPLLSHDRLDTLGEIAAHLPDRVLQV